MSGGERSSARRITVQEALRQVRHEVRLLNATRTILEEVRAALAAPSPEDLAQMERGDRPVSAEAHLLGVLQEAIGELEEVEENLRFGVRAKTLSRLEGDWRRGKLPQECDLQWIRAALERTQRLGGMST